MIITDVPQSGIYYQKGAIVQIVVQLIDIQTGLPINLQTATGLSILLLYPDASTAQTFNASLYTDGSDGRIAYVTQPGDLFQVGLYQMQGEATIAGSPLPLSYFTDFYVLKNVSGSSNQPSFNASALILTDTNSVRWGITVNTSGMLVPAATPFGPSNFLQFNSLVMKDANGVYWSIGINTDGTFNNVPGGTFPNALGSFILTDINGKSWVITISQNGVMEAA